LVKLGKNPEALDTITLETALEKALSHDLEMKIAHNQLDLSHAQKISRIAALLPKIKANFRYVRNIPKSKVVIGQPQDHLAQISRKLAELMGDKDRPGADWLQSQADLLTRRPIVEEIISKPEHLVEGSLSLIVPLFNSLDFARLISVNDAIKYQETHLASQKALTLYNSAAAYLKAIYYKNLLELRAHQSTQADQEHKKLLKRFKQKIISDVQILKSEHAYEELKLAEQSAQQEYNNALASLGFLIGQPHEFAIQSPDPEIFSVLEQSDEDLINFAHKSRPDLFEYQQILKRAERERIGAILQFVPNFFVQADANFTTNTKGLVRKPVSYEISLNAAYELFSGGATIGALKESSLHRQEAQLRLNDLSQRIDAQIRGQRESINRALLALKTQQSYISYALKLEGGMRSYYTNNQAKLDTYLDTIKARYEAEAALLKTEADLKQERLLLAYITGFLTPQRLSTPR
jgi:outer membrane protein TolC